MKMGANIKKANKDECRMLEATDISGMKVSNIFNDPSSSKQQIPVLKLLLSALATAYAKLIILTCNLEYCADSIGPFSISQH